MKKLLKAAQKPLRQLSQDEIDKVSGAYGSSSGISIGDGTWDWVDTHGTGGAPRQDYTQVD